MVETIVCRNCFLFEVEVMKTIAKYFGYCTTYEAITSDQLTIPLNELPFFYASENNGKHIEPSVPFYIENLKLFPNTLG